MASHSSSRFSRPRSIKEITADAEDFEFNLNIPFKSWLRAIETLYQEGHYAIQDGDYARGYQMLYRHSMLVVNCLRQHPEYKLYKPRLRELFDRQDDVFRDLERIKPYIERDYNEWLRMAEERQQRRRSRETTPVGPSASNFASRSHTVLNAADHQDLAVDMATRVLRRRETARQASRRGAADRSSKHWTSSSSSAMPTTTAAATAPPADLSGYPPYDNDNRFDLYSEMQSTRRNLDSRDSTKRHSYGDDHPMPQSSTYHYPSISKPRPADSWSEEEIQSASSSPYLPYPYPPPANNRDSYRRQPSPPPPPRPFQHQPYPPPFVDRSSSYRVPPPLPPPPVQHPPQYPSSLSLSILPDRPPKEPELLLPAPSSTALVPTSNYDETALAPYVPPASAPSTSPLPSKPERITFQSRAALENGEPLRSVFLPSALRPRFLELAADNTRRDLEMCGILCGAPVNNALFVQCLLIPDQKCTPDTCETENESLILDYCVSEDLMVIGWIHTHPTQTCFMSSRDLHTHAGYQVMMPESIAIVCAPRSEPSHGIFRLTKPPGLNYILDCRRTETFHPHACDNLYTDANGGGSGHVYETAKLDFYVKDLRAGKS